MNELRYTLLTDGGSDRVLLHIIDWLLSDLLPRIPIQGNFADFSGYKQPPPFNKLDQRIEAAILQYPCDIIFVHRDAENQTIKDRETEIQVFWEKTTQTKQRKLIPIIPVRMTEAWLLIDSNAIKLAAGNRNFGGDLTLPKFARLEEEPDPKNLLFNLIKIASNLKGRSLDKLRVHSTTHIIAEKISDYSPLRQMFAFQRFEALVRQTLQDLGLIPA